MTKFIVVGFCVLYYAAALYFLRGIRFTTKDLCLCGIAVAMTLVLDSIRVPLPTGATFPLCSPLPLMVLSIVTDHRLGIVSGWVCGIMAMLLIPVWQVVHWGQFFVEHMICFSCLGYVAVFGTDKRWKILCGLLLASFLKICGHLISGVVFFSQNAWDGWGAWGYSISYNLSSGLPELIIFTIVIAVLPLKNFRRLWQNLMN